MRSVRCGLRKEDLLRRQLGDCLYDQKAKGRERAASKARGSAHTSAARAVPLYTGDAFQAAPTVDGRGRQGEP
jgi:hypothetical protein